MNDSLMVVRRGQPFKALLLVLTIWVMGRAIGQAAVSTPSMPIGSIVYQLPIAWFDALTRQAADTEHRSIYRAGSTGLPNSSADDRVDAILSEKPGLNSPMMLSYQKLPQSRLVLAGQMANSGNVTLGSSQLVLARSISESSLRTPDSRKSDALSGYFWLYVRQGSDPESAGSGVPISEFNIPQYGASQAGAILTHRITGDSVSNVSAFARASTALASPGEAELALGIKAKPFGSLPVSLFAEQRFGPRDNGIRGTALYIAGGTGPDKLLPRTSLETYGQMGFVFARDDSYFYDASAALQTRILDHQDSKLTAGGAIWASGQEGASRIDIGPRVKFHMPVGPVNMQVSVDWRERIGGNAHPGSGAAVTISTGF